MFIKTFALLFFFYISSVECGKLDYHFSESFKNYIRCSDEEYTYEESTNSCYKFHVKGEAWTVAETKCKDEGAYLAIINSDLEAKVIKDIFAQIPDSALKITTEHYDQAAIGFRKYNETWKTVDGKTLAESGYSGWAANEPSDPVTELCGSMWRTSKLNDVPCDINLAYICERPAKPAPATDFRFWITGVISPVGEDSFSVNIE